MVTFTKFDAADHLDSPEAIAFYLTDAFETDDSDSIKLALGTVARTKGVAVAAETAGLSPDVLSRFIQRQSPQEFDKVRKLLGAAGLKLVAKPIQDTEAT